MCKLLVLRGYGKAVSPKLLKNAKLPAVLFSYKFDDGINLQKTYKKIVKINNKLLTKFILNAIIIYT